MRRLLSSLRLHDWGCMIPGAMLAASRNLARPVECCMSKVAMGGICWSSRQPNGGIQAGLFARPASAAHPEYGRLPLRDPLGQGSAAQRSA